MIPKLLFNIFLQLISKKTFTFKYYLSISSNSSGVIKFSGWSPKNNLNRQNSLVNMMCYTEMWQIHSRILLKICISKLKLSGPVAFDYIDSIIFYKSLSFSNSKLNVFESAQTMKLWLSYDTLIRRNVCIEN